MKASELTYYETINPGGFQAAARLERARVRRQKAKRDEIAASMLWITWCLVAAAVTFALWFGAMYYGLLSLAAQQ